MGSVKKVGVLILVLLFVAVCAIFLTESSSKNTTTKEKIKIGTVMPLSGEWAWFGRQGLSGIRAYINYAEQEGILDRPVEILNVDAQGDVQDTVTGTKRLVEGKEVHFLSAVFQALIPALLNGPLFLATLLTDHPCGESHI